MVKNVIRIYACDACGKEIKEEDMFNINGVCMDEDRHNPYNYPSRSEYVLYSNSEDIHVCTDCKKKYDMIKAYFVNDMINLFNKVKENKKIKASYVPENKEDDDLY